MIRKWLYLILGLVFVGGGAFLIVYGPTYGLPTWGGILALFVGCFIPSFSKVLATPHPHRERLLLAEGCFLVLAVSSDLLPNIFLWPCWGGMFCIFLYIAWTLRKTQGLKESA
jgi:hypothetical protein